ncbi:MAG: ABC transporter ATP-binding protein [Gammaproteobacteria bacterium]|nr:ABC transporter ATP-binding protein [Gammaproteobacteria bacterium]
MIELKAVNKQFRVADTEVPILTNIDLEISRGEFIAITGPSGSGKTTLMNILGLLDRPSSGQYLFEQQNVGEFDSDKLATLRSTAVGFIFQSFMLLPRLNVIENISLPLIYQNTPTQVMINKSIEMLVKVGMKDFGERKPAELSGGQQQRVAIARALVSNPKIILADEPTGALDSQTGQEIFYLLQELNHSEKTTIVIVTHDIDIAKQCRKVIKIQDGKIH